MVMIKTIKIERAQNTGRCSIDCSTEGVVLVKIPLNRLPNDEIKLPKNEYVLSLKCFKSHWSLIMTCKKITILMIEISEENISGKYEIKATISKLKFKNEIHVEAPIIILTGVNGVTLLHLISENYIYINGTITCKEILLKAKKGVYLFSETIIQCRKFSLNCLECFHYGGICNLEDDKILELNIVADLFHMNTEGRIGVRHKIFNENDCTNIITGNICATFSNLGKIKAISNIELFVKEILSLKNILHDTAQRLLKNPILMNPTLPTLKLPETDKKIRGLMESKYINLNIEKSIEDLVQLVGKHVILSVGENIVCEEFSTFSADSIITKSSKTINLEGNLKFINGCFTANSKISVSGIMNASALSISVGSFQKMTKSSVIEIKGTINVQNFICESSGSIKFFKDSNFKTLNSTITANCFSNNSHLVFNQNLFLNADYLVQNSNSEIFVGHRFSCCTNSGKSWNGITKATLFQIIPKRKINLNGTVTCNICEIVINQKLSKFVLQGTMNAKEKFLVTQKKTFGNKKLKKVYNIVINGNLFTKQILANDSALKLQCPGIIKINKSNIECPIYASQILSEKGSLIVLPVENDHKNIICNETWKCQGNVVQADTVEIAEFLCSTKKQLINGSLKAKKFIAKSTEENIEIFAKIEAYEIDIVTVQNRIAFDETSMIDCNMLTLTSHEVNVKGEIYNFSYDNKLNLDFNVNKFLNCGKIGLRNGQCVTSDIIINLTGDFINRGTVQSENLIEIKAENLLASTNVDEILASQNPKTIYSTDLKVICNKNIEDCSQLYGEWMEIYAKGNLNIQKQTTWEGGNVHAEVDGDVIVNGNISFTTLNCLSPKSIITSSDSIVEIILANLASDSFEHNGNWNSDNLRFHKIKNVTINGKMALKNVAFTFYDLLLLNEKSTLMAEVCELYSQIDGKMGNIAFKGIFNSTILNVNINGSMNVLENSILTLHESSFVLKNYNNNGKILVKHKSIVSADTFYQNINGKLCSNDQLQINGNIINNDGLLQTTDNLILSTHSLINLGKILSNGKCEITADSESNLMQGNLICERLHLNPRKRFALSGELTCNNCIIWFSNPTALVIIDGNIICENTITCFKTEQTNSQINYNFQIRGVLSAQSIEAANIGIELKPNSHLFIRKYCESNAINCNRMLLHEESVLAVESEDHHRKIICQKEWYQHGNYFHVSNFENIDQDNSTKLLFNGDVEAEKIFIKPVTKEFNVEIQGNMTANTLNVTNSGNIVIFQKTLIKCNDIHVSGLSFSNFGIIDKKITNILNFNVDVQQTINGNIGIFGSSDTEKLVMQLTGDLVNYGKILAKCKIELNLNNVLSTIKNNVSTTNFANFHYLEANKPIKIVSADNITIKAHNSIEDCSQFYAKVLNIFAEEDAICEADSKWKSGIVNIHCKQNFSVDGEVKFDAAKITAKSVSTSIYANIEISKVNLETVEFELSCIWQGHDFTLKEFKDDEILQLLSKNQYKESTEKLENLYNKIFKLSESGKLFYENATIFSKVFFNTGQLIIQNNLEIFASILQQNEDGQLTGENKVKLFVNSAPEFKGLLSSKALTIILMKSFLCSANVKTQKADISLLNTESSTFFVNSPMFVDGPLTIKLLDQKLQEDAQILERNLINGFKINDSLIVGTLKSEAFMELEENVKLILENENLNNENKIMLLNISSVYVKQKAAIVAKNYNYKRVEIIVGNMVMFNGILIPTNDTDEIDCLPYIEGNDIDVLIEKNIDYIGLSKFLTFFNEMELGSFGKEIINDV